MTEVTEGRRVLVVDDEPLIREAVAARLGRAGFDVVTAGSAEEGWTTISEDPPSAVVLDICMPGMSGFELLERLRSDDKTKLLPVVLLSALSDTDQIVQGLQRGASDYVVKPPSIPLLVARLNAEIDRHQHLSQTLEQMRTMDHLAHHDELTGLYNRRGLLCAVDIEFRRMHRYHHPLTLLMLDLDEFKEINDTYGHPAGDQVLRQMAGRLTSSLRGTDFVARYGGEEFAVILPETDSVAGAQVAENIRLSIQATPFTTNAGPIDLTASLGLASAPDPAIQTVGDLVQKADQALYEAKHQGRNRICMHRATA